MLYVYEFPPIPEDTTTAPATARAAVRLYDAWQRGPERGGLPLGESAGALDAARELGQGFADIVDRDDVGNGMVAFAQRRQGGRFAVSADAHKHLQAAWSQYRKTVMASADWEDADAVETFLAAVPKMTADEYAERYGPVAQDPDT